jgi:hypothetical protein
MADAVNGNPPTSLLTVVAAEQSSHSKCWSSNAAVGLRFGTVTDPRTRPRRFAAPGSYLADYFPARPCVAFAASRS